MIRALQISNYAIIEHIDIHFDTGFTVFTGETGAGKSIILGALGLILGNRADSSVLFDESKKSYVEATFDLSSYENLRPLFEQLDLDYDDESIIRREISTSGKSRAFINDSPVTLGKLREVTSLIIDLHQQFDLLEIQKVPFQQKMMDVYAGTLKELSAFKKEYKNLQKLENELEALIEKQRESQKEQEFLQFQYNELEVYDFDDLDQVAMEAELNMLENADEISQLGSLAQSCLLEDENSVQDQLILISKNISNLSGGNAKLEKLLEQTDHITEQVRELADELTRYADGISGDEEQKLKLEEILSGIYKLLQKHQAADILELAEIKEKISNQLSETIGLDHKIVETKKRIEASLKQSYALAKKLSSNRKKSIKPLQKEVDDLIHNLGMEQASFEIQHKITDTISSNGIDLMEFYFKPNPGSKSNPIKDTASGGEISRLTLAIKSIAAKHLALGTQIYDEIDTGVSGAVALKMGNILKALSMGKQVISITHSAQIASRADQHFFIYKQSDKTRTYTKVRQLDKEERITELAKILSGDPPSQAAITNAQELILL